MYTKEVYHTQVDWDKCKHHSVNPKLVILAVQGLIYHFKNRNWILGDSYAYGQQSYHGISFNKDRPHLNYFKKRLEEAGVLHLVDIIHQGDHEMEGDAPKED